MSFLLVVGGRHSAGAIVRRLRRQMAKLEDDNKQLTERAEAADAYVHEARMRACQDAMLIARLRSERAELAAAVARMEEQHGKAVRGLKLQAAELARRLELRSQTEAVVTKTQPMRIPTYFAATKLASADPGRASVT